MTRIVNLIGLWERAACGPLTRREYRVRLPVQDAARIAALAEMYPRRSEGELIADLLGAALDELEIAMPYVPGPRVASEDEEGNSIYEDAGPTPRFLELSRKHCASLQDAVISETVPEPRPPERAADYRRPPAAA
jgi:hypothetical protein